VPSGDKRVDYRRESKGEEGRIGPSGTAAWMVALCAFRSPPTLRSFSGKRQMPTTKSVSGCGSAAPSTPGPAGPGLCQYRGNAQVMSMTRH